MEYSGQELADRLGGGFVQPIASMGDPPGAAHAQALQALPTPQQDPAPAVQPLSHSFRAGLGF